jgi:hypothetical protein
MNKKLRKLEKKERSDVEETKLRKKGILIGEEGYNVKKLKRAVLKSNIREKTYGAVKGYMEKKHVSRKILKKNKPLTLTFKQGEKKNLFFT